MRAADVMVANIAGAQKAVIAETAHIPSMEKPAEFNKIVLDFLGGIA
jgi:pimeloyl-ACP methyl ester carboxylesterase